MKSTKEYNVIFSIVGSKDENDYYYFYNPKENGFGFCNILKIYRDYVVVSDRLKSRLESIEEEMEIKKR